LSNSSAINIDAPLRIAPAGLPAFNNRRTDVLAKRIALHLESLAPQGRISCLDIGSGDLTLAEAVQEHVSRADWSCVGVNRIPADGSDARPRSREVSHPDGSFDVALLCDVLHDMPDEDAGFLLTEAARVARHVIVKDCFEPSPYSPTMLHAMDLGGTRGDGGGLPRYLTREAFVQITAERELAITALDCDLHLDFCEHLPIVGATPRHEQFIAVLARRGCKKDGALSKV